MNIYIRQNRAELLKKYRSMDSEDLAAYREIAEDSRDDKITTAIRGGPRARLRDVQATFDAMQDAVHFPLSLSTGHILTPELVESFDLSHKC